MHRVLLNLGQGSWETGFLSVIVQLWKPNQAAPIQWTGSLPASNTLRLLHSSWHNYYMALQSNLGLRRTFPHRGIKIEDNDVTHISIEEFSEVCKQLQRQLNLWLSVETFADIERKLRTILNVEDSIQLIVQTDNSQIRSFPWHLWSFLNDYPKAEVGLSTLDFRSGQTLRKRSRKKIRVLAIFGSTVGIDLEKDKAQLQKISDAEVVMLTEPSRVEFSQYLWDDKGWDILFFAGHSSITNQGETGYVELNASERISIPQLKKTLNEAIERGLQLAIFNSCEGLGIARDLADLNIPQTIAMREPVPDQVAQAFLLNFLQAFSQGMPLYLAVRKARERLETLEGTFQCASWLPVICQNPAISEVLTWQTLRKPLSISDPFSKWQKWQQIGKVALASLVSAGLVIGIRQAGWLQPAELRTFDHLMRLRPKDEEADQRLLLITVTEADVQAQANRQGSISDRKLSQLIEKLKKYEPRVIGLDIYRDLPSDPKYKSLIQAFQQDPTFLTVCRFGKGDTENPGIGPSPHIPENKILNRVGFSDGLVDQDGVVRRHLLGMSPPKKSHCPANNALSLMLALRYLLAEGIEAEVLGDGRLKIGNIVLPYFQPNTGSYQEADAKGYQIMLNYRSLSSVEDIAERLTLDQILNQNYSASELSDLIRNQVVLIGTVASSFEDYHATPYSWQTAGVFIHAHQVSQLLSAALDGRPLIKDWPQFLENIWIISWALMGGAVVLIIKNRRVLTFAVLGMGGLGYGICFIFMTQAFWVPLVPPLLALTTAYLAALTLVEPTKVQA